MTYDVVEIVEIGQAEALIEFGIFGECEEPIFDKYECQTVLYIELEEPI